METIDKIIRINTLYDKYKELLTDKQKEYFEAFYFENMSLHEIAENYDVSRNAVYSQLNLTVDTLEKYETKLHLKEKDEKLSNLFDKLKELNLKEVDDILKTYEEE